MESKAFHICPFCQSPSPVAAPRCVRCDRALAGLPLPVYGSELDVTPLRSAPADLADLPLRDTIAETPRPAPAVTSAAPGRGSETRRVRERGRGGRAARLAVAIGVVGAALVGGWLVRAQDRRREPEAREITAAAAPATTVPSPAVPVSLPAAVPSPAMAAPSPVVPRTAATPSLAEPAPRVTAPPDTEAPRPTAPRARRPAAVPIYEESEVTTVHPDVSARPVDVERARDDFGRDSSAPEADARTAALHARLERAQQRRDALAERVRELRARTDVPVIKDVEEYQRLQDYLSAALDDLDRADAEVVRLRRALRRRGE